MTDEMLALYHEPGCGDIALWATPEAVATRSNQSIDYRMPNGEKPRPCTQVVCGACGRPFSAYPVLSRLARAAA